MEEEAEGPGREGDEEEAEVESEVEVEDESTADMIGQEDVGTRRMGRQPGSKCVMQCNEH